MRPVPTGELKAPSIHGSLWMLAALALAPILAVGAALYSPACAIYGVLKVPCPGCGLGRSLTALAHLDLWGAVGHYPPLPAIVLGYAALLGGALSRLRRARRPRLRAGNWTNIGTIAAIVIAVAVIGNWVAQLMAAVARP